MDEACDTSKLYSFGMLESNNGSVLLLVFALSDSLAPSWLPWLHGSLPSKTLSSATGSDF
jgi:hypothetical protein